MKSRLIIFSLFALIVSCIDPKEKREESKRLANEGKFEESLIAINQAIKSEPDSISNYGVRVFIYEALGQYQEEIEDLNKIIEVSNGSFINTYFQRSLTYIQLGQYEKALSDIDFYIEKRLAKTPDGNLADAYLNKASILYKLNESQKAKEFYNMAIDENQDQNATIESQALVGLANLSNSSKEGLTLLNNALELDSKNSFAYAARGKLFLNALGKIEKAYGDLSTAIKLNPRNAEIYFNMGQLFANYTNELDSAVFYYEKSINLSPQPPLSGEVYLNLAVLSYQTNNVDRALFALKNAESIIPENDLLLYNYAMILSDLSSNNEALVKINKAIKTNPEDPEYFNLKGSILLELSSYEEAIIEYNRAIDLNPKYGLAYYNMGYLFGELDRHIESINYYNQAVKLQYDLESTLVNRAIQKFKIDKTSEGCSDLKKAYQLGRTDIKPLIDERCK